MNGKSFKKELEHFKPNIVVCHSLANILWFHTCDELDIKLDKLMLVAPVSKIEISWCKNIFPYPISKRFKIKWNNYGSFNKWSIYEYWRIRT